MGETLNKPIRASFRESILLWVGRKKKHRSGEGSAGKFSTRQVEGGGEESRVINNKNRKKDVFFITTPKRLYF